MISLGSSVFGKFLGLASALESFGVDQGGGVHLLRRLLATRHHLLPSMSIFQLPPCGLHFKAALQSIKACTKIIVTNSVRTVNRSCKTLGWIIYPDRNEGSGLDKCTHALDEDRESVESQIRLDA